MSPVVSSLKPALALPMPTLPLAAMLRLLVGAPGRIRNGSGLPRVTSRMKKFASLQAMSQVYGEKTPLGYCSRRRAGVLLLRQCISSTGVDVPKQTLPAEDTKIELARARALTRNTWRLAVECSMAKKLEPRLAVSLAINRESLAGNALMTLVSSKKIRRLFSLRTMVSEPKAIPLAQSKPTHRLPVMMTSSLNT